MNVEFEHVHLQHAIRNKDPKQVQKSMLGFEPGKFSSGLEPSSLSNGITRSPVPRSGAANRLNSDMKKAEEIFIS